jgi:hypothetical protein
MKVLEKHVGYAHWRDLNISFSYTVDSGVKLKRSVKISISGKLLEEIDDKEVGNLLSIINSAIRNRNK